MEDERVARLTEGQRVCLRMVYRHMQTKEIARSLNISPDGVSQRIKTAMRTLGVHRRRDAARILAEAEGLSSYPPHVHPPEDLAWPPRSFTIGASIEPEWTHRDVPAGELRERQSAYATSSQAPGGRLQVPLPLWGAQPADLGALQRLGWIFGLIVAFAFTFGVFFTGAEALSRVGRALH